MEAPATSRLALGDPGFIDQIVNQIKSQGTFDKWRRECLSDVDTKPAYQNLHTRVDQAVGAYLSKQQWKPNMVKNQVRENLRKHIIELGVVEKGVDRIVEQVVQPKVLPTFYPAVETAIYSYLGIEKPVKSTPSAADMSDRQSNTGSPTKKAFKPMPVFVPTRRDQEGITPPPGEEFEAITPSPNSSRKCRSRSVSEVSDVSMEDNTSRPADADEIDLALERICSPVSPQSSPPSFKAKISASGTRAVSALSAISSGDELPSSSSSLPTSIEEVNERIPSAKQPLEMTTTTPIPGVDSDDTRTPIPGVGSEGTLTPIPGIGSPRSMASASADEDDDSDSSSPEFERLDVIPRPQSADLEIEDKEEEEDENKIEQTDSGSQHETNRKTPDDEDNAGGTGDLGPRTNIGGSSADAEPSTSSQEQQEPPSGSGGGEGKSAASNADPIVSTISTVEVEPSATSDRSKSSGSRSKSESHRSERKEKSSSSSSRKDKVRDKEREREREKRREREERERRKKKSSKSERRDREDEKKKSSHRDRERQKEKDRIRSSESKNRSNVEKKRSQRSPSPPTNGWKRPEEMSTLLKDYLNRFGQIPDEEGEDHTPIEKLTDVTVSSISSYEDSDAESTTHLWLSEVELDSELEVELINTGGRITYLPEGDPKENPLSAEFVSVPIKKEVIEQSEPVVDQQKKEAAPSSSVEQQQNKRLRRVNTRYSDSYVGSEFRRVTSQHSTEDQLPQSPFNNSVKRELEDNGVSESSSELSEKTASPMEGGQPRAKRAKKNSISSAASVDQLPSSPESCQSDHPSKLVIVEQPPSSTPPPPGEEAAPVVNILPSAVSRRRSAAAKQPQQRYDDTDLYKPRPVITPSSRRSRRPDDP